LQSRLRSAARSDLCLRLALPSKQRQTSSPYSLTTLAVTGPSTFANILNARTVSRKLVYIQSASRSLASTLLSRQAETFEELTNWYDRPGRIQAHEIGIIIKALRARIADATVIVIHDIGEVVQHHAVELAATGEGLGRVPEGRVREDQVGGQQAQRTPGPGGDALDDHDGGVGGQVARVGFRVLLPGLAEEVGFAGHGQMVVGEVAFDEEVDRSGFRVEDFWFINYLLSK
jgi:hypothetical protein